MRVVFCTAVLTQYRLPFHEAVRNRLASFGIAYDVIYGNSATEYPSDTDEAVKKAGLASLSWGKPVNNRYFRVGRRSVLWQPVLTDVWASDLVIIGDENRLLTNYVIQGLRELRLPKIALWGHGRNFQTDSRLTLAAHWKRIWATRCDWWFAYTEKSRQIVETYGFPAHRITVIHNAIDTSEIRRLIGEIGTQQLVSLQIQLGLHSRHVAVYVGSLYSHKRLDFLIEAAKEIRRQLPDFLLAIVGDGPDRALVQRAAAQHPWIRYLGPLFGNKKAEILRLGRVFVMPGLVGLGIVDCAAAGLPIVTTTYPFHSPEIAYLEPGRNGLIVSDWLNSKAYADAVVSVLLDDRLHSCLAAGARQIGAEITIERMVDCFCQGVIAALDAPKYENSH